MNALFNRRFAMDWNQITQAIQGLGKDVSGKVKETADVLKLRQKANAEKQRIRLAYEEIGRLYYKEFEGKEVAAEYQDLFDTIVDATAAVNDFKSKIEELRNTKTCPECGAEMDREAAFCAKCGAKMPEPEPEEEEAADADFCEAEECEAADEAADETAEAAEECAEAEHEEAQAEEADAVDACGCEAAEEDEAVNVYCADEDKKK
jgi:hypothetical protein